MNQKIINLDDPDTFLNNPAANYKAWPLPDLLKHIASIEKVAVKWTAKKKDEAGYIYRRGCSPYTTKKLKEDVWMYETIENLFKAFRATVEELQKEREAYVDYNTFTTQEADFWRMMFEKGLGEFKSIPVNGKSE